MRPCSRAATSPIRRRVRPARRDREPAVREPHWPGEDPLGKRVRLFDGGAPGTWLTVVGVASNIVQDGPDRHAHDPAIYRPYRQAPSAGMWVLVRSRAPQGSLAAAFRGEIRRSTPICRSGWGCNARRAAGRDGELLERPQRRGALHCLRRDRAAACDGRPLRRGGARGQPAHAGDWDRMALGATPREIRALVLCRACCRSPAAWPSDWPPRFGHPILSAELVRVSPGRPGASSSPQSC